MASEAVSGENTVRLLDHGEEGTLYYLVFEHVDGTLLSEELKAGPLTPERAVGVTIQVAQALTVAHEQNVVHRNLIPDNIVLLRNGGVKVRDFGLSRLLDDRDDDTLTRAGASIGTLAYMAPEYAEDQTVSPAGDAYALGGLMFAMVSGRTPPVMGKMRVPGNVPVWLAELIQQLRTLEAEARPTAADVVSRLERGATNEVQAAPVEEPPAGSLRYVAGIGFVALALFAAAARMLIR